jgi:hypothetical protein
MNRISTTKVDDLSGSSADDGGTLLEGVREGTRV